MGGLNNSYMANISDRSGFSLDTDQVEVTQTDQEEVHREENHDLGELYSLVFSSPT